MNVATRIFIALHNPICYDDQGIIKEPKMVNITFDDFDNTVYEGENLKCMM